MSDRSAVPCPPSPVSWPLSERAAAFVRPRRWVAAAAGVVVWAAWLGSNALGNGEFDYVGQLVAVDHLAFYSPARMIREGRGAEIYDHAKLLEYQRQLFPPGMWQAFEAYRNPPFYALLYYPTAGLPYWASAWLWCAIGLITLAVGIRWLGPARPWAAFGWALTFLPVFSTVSYGQNTLLSFAVFCATYRLLTVGRPFAAGLVAGLLWFKPPLLIGFVLWGLLDLRRLWPAAVGVAVAGAVLTVGTYPLVPGAWQQFFATLKENMGYDNFDWWKMHNPRSFWRELIPVPIHLTDGVTLQGVLWLVCAAPAVWLFFRVWRARRDDLPAVFGASVLMMLWVSPHTMIYEWSLAVVPAVLWWSRLPQYRAAWTVLFAVGWVALFVATDFARAQVWLETDKLGYGSPVVVLVSVPLLAWVGWRAARVLSAARGPELAAGGPVVVPDGVDGSRGLPAGAAGGSAGSTP